MLRTDTPRKPTEYIDRLKNLSSRFAENVTWNGTVKTETDRNPLAAVPAELAGDALSDRT